jgi:hypothetical protein
VVLAVFRQLHVIGLHIANAVWSEATFGSVPAPSDLGALNGYSEPSIAIYPAP